MTSYRDSALLTTTAPRTTPSWRALVVLVLLVLTAHALLLRGLPSQFGPPPFSPEQPERHTAFVTRRVDIAVPPAVLTSPAKKPPQVKKLASKKPAPKTIQKPISQPVVEPQEIVPPQPVDSLAITPHAESPPDATPEAVSLSDSETTSGIDNSAAMLAAQQAAAAPAAVASATTTPPPLPPTTPVTAMALPASVMLNYKMTGSAKGLNYFAKGELDWLNTGSSYEARIVVSALFLGSRSMTSNGQMGPEGLAPMRFSDKSRSEVAAHFEPKKGQISFSANTPSVPWVKGAQDRVSVFLQLGGMLAGNPAAFPIGSAITVYTVGPRSADTWTFTVEAEEKLDLPIGPITTLKLARQPRLEYDQKVEIWFAPSLGYLPARTKITQANGDFVDQQLDAVNRP